DIVKYRSLKEPEIAAKLSLKCEGNRDFPWVMTVDAHKSPVIIWTGGDRGSLLRMTAAEN
ncbi:hypothetical protein ACFL6F_03815, partial [Planctomycetota bacterium]